MASQKGLGKGLGALFGEMAAVAVPDSQDGAVFLPIQKVEPNPLQPRKQFDPEELAQLADSIAAHGMIQPLTVRKLEGDFYQIIAGERRWRAARQAGLKEVPVRILQADDQTVAELALIENLQRQDLNPMEEAQGYQHLIGEYHMSQEAVAQCVGKSRPAIANALRLLQLPEPVASMVKDGKLSAGHGRAVLMLKTPAQQAAAAQKIAALDLSVRQAELLCRSMAREKPAPKEKDPLAVDYLAECERQLSKTLGRGVKIVNGRRKGRFELEFYGQDDLQRLLTALQSLEIRGGQNHG